MKASMPSPFGGLTSIGVDETGYRKGHTCITVVVDHERHRAIWAHDGYGRDVFGLFFQTLTPEQRASIRVVAGDGARWIDSCVHEWCPNAERAPDGVPHRQLDERRARQPTKTAEASFLCYPVKLRDGSSFSPFEPCRPTSPFADRDTITPRMAEFQRFRNSYCGTPR